MKILGITGNIGTGKSTIALIFKTLGIPVYNSDDRAKEFYFKKKVRKRVISLLSKKAYKNKSTLNKKYISKLVFNNSKLLAKLNAIIHPVVSSDFDQFKKQHRKKKYIVKESALLIEAGLLKKVDKLLLVTTTPQLQLERLKKRDKKPSSVLKKIMDNQIPDKEKRKYADWEIKNNETTFLIPQVLKIHKALSKHTHAL